MAFIGREKYQAKDQKEMNINKILLIDDDKIVLRTIQKLLVKEGYQLTIIESGQKALELIKNSFYDLIITDIRMPQIDGIETINKIRRLQEAGDLKSKFMIITGYSDADVSKEATEMGIKHFLMKPFDRDSFLKSVEECLGCEPISSKSTPLVDNKTLIDHFIKEQQEENERFLSNKTKPIIGWTNTYIPEEIIMAAGFLSYRIMGAPISLSQSKSYLSGNISSHVQSMLECALRGDYKFIDGVVIGASTDATKRLYDAWIRYAGASFNHLFDIPKIFGENALIHYKESIKALIEDIEKHFKVKINEQSLRNAISVCNETRRLLLQLNNLRKETNPSILATQMLEICKLAMSSDKASFNKELQTLLGQLGLSREKEEHQYRILLTGSFEDQDWLLNAVEEAGGSIVCEDTCTRLRYFYGLVDKDTEPTSAIAKRYMEYKIPSAGLVSFERRSETILRLVNEFKIDAVIYYILKFDDPYLFEFPEMKDFFDNNGIPVLRIETEHNTSAIGQINTRLQAFMETLKLRSLKKAKANGRTYQKNPV